MYECSYYANKEDFSSSNLDSEVTENLEELNKLALNVNKIKLMIFRKRKSINHFKIDLDNIEISESDVRLSWLSF